MIGILLVTHGTFSEGIVNSIDLIMGKPKSLDLMTLKESDNLELFKEEFSRKLEKLDEGDGVLVLVDLLGGSPFNVSAVSLPNVHAECITGLNLPMVLEALDSRRTQTLEELVDTCMNSAVDGIINVRKQLSI